MQDLLTKVKCSSDSENEISKHESGVQDTVSTSTNTEKTMHETIEINQLSEDVPWENDEPPNADSESCESNDEEVIYKKHNIKA